MKKKLTDGILMQGGGADENDVRFLTGFTAPDPFYALQIGSRCHMILSPLEIGRARKIARASKLYAPDQLQLKPGQRYAGLHQIKALANLQGIQSVRVSHQFPALIVDGLRRARIKVEVESGTLFPKRAIKSAAEIECLKEAQRTAVRAMRHAIAILKGSSIGSKQTLRWQGKVLTSERLRTEIKIHLLRAGYGGAEPIVAGGDQATDPHEIGYGPLRAHSPIILDIFPRSAAHGYWGDITRTVIKGDPSPEVQALYNTVLKAQKQALSKVRAGVNAQEIHQGVSQYFKNAGYETDTQSKQPRGFFHGTGHGVGLEIHEAPSVSLRENILKAGHVITIEPGLYYPGLGGVRIEDTVVVRKEGFDFLATCPKTFVLK